MPKVPDVVSGEPIEASWGNQDIRDKTVQIATNQADLIGSYPGSDPGTCVYVLDSGAGFGQLYMWTDTPTNPGVYGWKVVTFGPDSGGHYLAKLEGGRISAPAGLEVKSANEVTPAPVVEIEGTRIGIGTGLGSAKAGTSVLDLHYDDAVAAYGLRLRTSESDGESVEQANPGPIQFKTGAIYGHGGFSGPGAILLQAPINTAEVPNGTQLVQLIIHNPGVPAGARVWIEYNGMAGFSGVAVQAGVNASGPTFWQYAFADAAAARWAGNTSFGYYDFADDTTEANKLVLLLADATAAAYYRGIVRVWTEGIFGSVS